MANIRMTHTGVSGYAVADLASYTNLWAGLGWVNIGPDDPSTAGVATGGFAPAWAAATAYAVGQVAISPAGALIVRKTAGTSRSSYDATEKAAWRDSDAAYPTVTNPTDAATQQASTSGAVTVALTGHSLMYGQDTTGTGTNPAVNGATQTRSSTPPPEQFATMAGFVAPGTVTVTNQGYPGDRSTEAVSRWTAGTSGNIEFFWVDVNDANDYGGYGSTLTDAQSVANLATLIQRAKGRGAEVVLVGGSPDGNTTASRKTFASAQASRALADRYGCRYIDAGELLRAMPKAQGMFSSAPHLSPNGYGIVGARLAALVGPKGTNPPKVAPGSVITPRDMLHKFGTVTTRSGAADGTTVKVDAGVTCGVAVEVTAPCIPIIRYRVESTTIGYGVVGFHYALDAAGWSAKYSSITAGAAATGYAYLRGPAMLSPGPDVLVMKCESGSVEWDSITFVPVDGLAEYGSGNTFDLKRGRRMNLRPVGGQAVRSDGSWDAVLDTTNAVSLLSGAAQTTKEKVRWTFDLTTGSATNGVLLAQDITISGAGYLIQHGYMIFRNGSTLTVRKFDAGTVTDTNVASAFTSATGMLRNILDLTYDSATGLITVWLDGVSQTTFTPAWSTFMPGLLAAATASLSYASAHGTVYQSTTAEL